MVATEEQISPSRITARLFAWLAPLLFLFAALAAVPVSATASAKALCVPQNRIGGNPATAPFAMLPTIASPDWSKNLFVPNDPAHGISKFLGGQAVTTLATAGTSELPEALSSGTEEATNLLPGATTGVTGLAEAKTATTLSEDTVKTPTADTVTAKVPSAAGKATEEDVASFENEGGGQAQGQAVAKKPVPNPHGKPGGPVQRMELDMAKQGKHIPGHQNFIPGRSELTADPIELAKSAGKGRPVGVTPRGAPGFKERVDFGKVIGRYVDPITGKAVPTTKAIIHYAKDGIHIVPARP